MKYKCLILDHDDTVVDSTRSVNFESFKNVLKVIRPNINMTIDEFFKYNYDPGFMDLCYKILNFTSDEMDYQVKSWKAYLKQFTPDLFPGIKEILWDFVNMGGKIFVVSLSNGEDILRHYKSHELPIPEKIYGWEYPEHQRKPNTFPVDDIIRNFGFNKSEMVMVDDLKPGKLMADSSGIDFISAAWAYEIKEIQDDMKRTSKYFCSNVEDLRAFLFL